MIQGRPWHRRAFISAVFLLYTEYSEMFSEVQPRKELQSAFRKYLVLSNQEVTGGDRTAMMKTRVLFHVASRQVRRHVFPLRVPERRIKQQPKTRRSCVFTFPRSATDGFSSCTYGGAVEEPNEKPAHFTRPMRWTFERT